MNELSRDEMETVAEAFSKLPKGDRAFMMWLLSTLAAKGKGVEPSEEFMQLWKNIEAKEVSDAALLISTKQLRAIYEAELASEAT